MSLSSNVRSFCADWPSDNIPNPDEVIAVHALRIAQFGGSLGVRDRGTIESALAGPQSGYYEDIIQEAAALWESLSQNHPFVDGNKRTAMEVAFVFLEFNGICIAVSEEEACLTFLRLAAGEITESELASWFAKHTTGL